MLEILFICWRRQWEFCPIITLIYTTWIFLAIVIRVIVFTWCNSCSWFARKCCKTPSGLLSLDHIHQNDNRKENRSMFNCSLFVPAILFLLHVCRNSTQLVAWARGRLLFLIEFILVPLKKKNSLPCIANKKHWVSGNLEREESHQPWTQCLISAHRHAQRV